MKKKEPKKLSPTIPRKDSSKPLKRIIATDITTLEIPFNTKESIEKEKNESCKSNATRTTERQKILEEVWNHLDKYERKEWLLKLGYVECVGCIVYSNMKWNDLPDEFISWHIDYEHNLTLEFIREIKETLEGSSSSSNKQKILLLTKLEIMLKKQKKS